MRKAIHRSPGDFLGTIKEWEDDILEFWPVYLFVNVIYWVMYWALSKSIWNTGLLAKFGIVHSSAIFILVFVPAIVFQIALLVISLKARKAVIAANLVSGASLLLCLYSGLYLFYGSAQNFGSNLSKVDAFYFALGILTTAGTGTIAPVSEFARILTSSQYVVDLFYVVGIIAIGTARLTPTVLSARNRTDGNSERERDPVSDSD